jgi:hypothetical protein
MLAASKKVGSRPHVGEIEARPWRKTFNIRLVFCVLTVPLTRSAFDARRRGQCRPIAPLAHPPRSDERVS